MKIDLGVHKPYRGDMGQRLFDMAEKVFPSDDLSPLEKLARLAEMGAKVFLPRDLQTRVMNAKVKKVYLFWLELIEKEGGPISIRRLAMRASKRFGYKEDTIRDWVTRGELPYPYHPAHHSQI